MKKLMTSICNPIVLNTYFTLKQIIFRLFVFSVVILCISESDLYGAEFSGLYATTYEHDLIQINNDGTWNTVFDLHNESEGQPNGLAFRDSNTVYITSYGPNWGQGLNYAVGKMNVYNSDGTIIHTVSQIPVTNIWANGSGPQNLVIDTNGTAYIATHNSPGATKVTSNWEVSDWTGYVYDLWWGKDAALSPTGELFMTNSIYGTPNTNGNVAKIDKITGNVTFILTGLDWTGGISFDSIGNMYLCQPRLNRLVQVPVNTTDLISYADIPLATASCMGDNNILYVTESDNKIWKVDLNNGNTSLYASNLPGINRIAYSPVPEPSTFVLLSVGIITLLAYTGRRRDK
jgi:hypothetical protein